MPQSRKPCKPHSFSDEQWDAYLSHFALTYESYRVGVCVWLCRRGHDECVEADWLQALAHDCLLKEMDCGIPQ